MTLAKDAYQDYDPSGMDAGKLPLVENVRVLEIGFGSGALLDALRARGNELHGVDAGKEIVRKAREKGHENLYHLDISEEPLPFEDDFFDAVYAYEVFEHLTNPHRMFHEVRRILKPERNLYFSVPTQEDTMGYGPGRHSFVYPGLLERANLERFFMQMYFRIEKRVEDEPALIRHRSYILRNMKRPGLPDIVEVVAGDYSVRALYGHVLTENELEAEVGRDVAPYLALAEGRIAARDWESLDKLLNVIEAFYSEYHPAYLALAETLAKYGEKETALAMLRALASNPSLPPEIRARAEELSRGIGGG
ncbi:MAG: class I SAM-dependent methyltransferase [Candidatus Nitrospinota bacterium M3_3B_026]